MLVKIAVDLLLFLIGFFTRNLQIKNTKDYSTDFTKNFSNDFTCNFTKDFTEYFKQNFTKDSIGFY